MCISVDDNYAAIIKKEHSNVEAEEKINIYI